MDLSEDEIALLKNIRSLQMKMREETFKKYRRINPFFEDLFDWKERGNFWTKKNGVTIYNSATVSGNVDIGECTWIGPFVTLDGSGGLKIGHHCSISLGCQLVSHDTVKWALSGGVEDYERQPIEIGDCCFLGSNVVISKGVKIGDHCLVAAGAVVTKNFNSYSIIGGVPAKQIGFVEINDSKRINFRYQKMNDE